MAPENHIEEQESHGLYGVSPDLFKNLLEALEAHDRGGIAAIIRPLHAADVADILQNLHGENRHSLIEILRPTFDPNILSYLDDSVRDEVIEQIGMEDLAAALSDLESDDALSVLEDLDQKRQREVLRAISAKDRAILEEVLTYPEDSAGRLMQREVAVVASYWTVGEILIFLGKSQELPETYYNVYVVNPKHQPIGCVPLCRLLQHGHSTQLEEIMETEIYKVPVTMDKEEVARLFHHYGLVSAPVIDSANRLVGMVTVDDVVDVIEEEATEDIMHLAGITSSDFHAPVAESFLMRFRWLFVTLVSSLLAAMVISQFQASIQQKVALAVLMPIVAAMGGNAGMQVVTVTIRALATRDLRRGNLLRTLSKELSVGALNGVLFALLLGLMTALFFEDAALGMVLGGALIFNMVWAAFAGIMLPVTISKLGLDPALSAGPLLTTTTDVLGFAVFLGLASMLLL